MIRHRPATCSDASVIARLHAGLFPDGWSEADVAGMLGAPPSVSVVAETDARVVGFLLGRVVAGEAEILSLGVDRALQGRSVGQNLLAHWLMMAHAAGATEAVLEVATDNGPALAVYRRAGFRETGRRIGYYLRGGHDTADALTMSLTMPPV